MSTAPLPALLLETSWIRASFRKTPTYRLTLTNQSSSALSGFRLYVSGPGKIETSSEVQGGDIGQCLSNFAEFLPPDGFELGAGEAWRLSVRGLTWPLRHWTDGAQSAYLILDDGSMLPATVGPTVLSGHAAEPKRGAEIYPIPARPPAPVSIVPWPNHVSVSGRRPAVAGLALHASEPSGVAAAASFSALTERLFAVEGIVRPLAEGGIPVLLHVADGFVDEAYRVSFTADAVTVSAGGKTGLLYGLVTLGQIWRGARFHPQSFDFPIDGEIVDAPAMGWRGLHLDVARQFYATSEIKKLLAVAGWNKLNRFHWHLSDDEAWRVEIQSYPALTEVGAWRGHGLPIPPLLGSDPTPTGGYYTKDAVRAIVALAGEFGIEVVPEIDLPGHSFAILQALPELRDPDEGGSYHSVQGFPDNCLNPALDKTYEVLETILRELIPLFPFRTIHIGADEVPLGAWSGSPVALAKLVEVAGQAVADNHAKRLNVISGAHGTDDITGSGAAVLQAMFIERIHKFLVAEGCTTGGWEEASYGNVIDRTTSYLCGWRSVEICAALADDGYEMVVCPGQFYYLDMANGPEWDEPGGSWAGWASPEKVYAFDPVQGWTEQQKKKLRGIQACIWSESMKDRAVFDRLVFPRLSALAETGWTRPSEKSWERFRALVGLMPVLYGRT